MVIERLGRVVMTATLSIPMTALMSVARRAVEMASPKSVKSAI
jgi:hypothetical protein